MGADRDCQLDCDGTGRNRRHSELDRSWSGTWRILESGAGVLDAAQLLFHGGRLRAAAMGDAGANVRGNCGSLVPRHTNQLISQFPVRCPPVLAIITDAVPVNKLATGEEEMF